MPHLKLLRRAMLTLFVLGSLALGAGCGSASDSTGSEEAEAVAGTGLGRLKKAVKDTDVSAVTEAGHGLSVTEYPAGTKAEHMVAETAGEDDDVRLSAFRKRSGAAAVEAVVARLEDAVANGREHGDESGRVAAELLQSAATATTSFFLPVTKFASVEAFSHGIEEDGDLESHTLIATKKDGSFVVFGYTNFPF